MHRLIRSSETWSFVFACLLVVMGNDPQSASCDELEPAKVSLADVEKFVGEWVIVPKENYNLAATLKVSLILDKHFLEVDGQVFVPGHAFEKTKAIISCTQTEHCFRLWQFDTHGEITEARGAWNRENSTLTFTSAGTEKDGASRHLAIRLLNHETLAFSRGVDESFEEMPFATFRRVPRPAESGK